MRKKELEEIIDKRADEMARSGNYRDWLSIERALREEGFLRARQILDDSFRRSELDEMCQQAQAGDKGEQK